MKFSFHVVTSQISPCFLHFSQNFFSEKWERKSTLSPNAHYISIKRNNKWRRRHESYTKQQHRARANMKKGKKKTFSFSQFNNDGTKKKEKLMKLPRTKMSTESFKVFFYVLFVISNAVVHRTTYSYLHRRLAEIFQN